jgi:ABC-type uncharacterized transport system ATPase subunit
LADGLHIVLDRDASRAQSPFVGAAVLLVEHDMEHVQAAASHRAARRKQGGKTTLLDAMSGVLPVADGDVLRTSSRAGQCSGA